MKVKYGTWTAKALIFAFLALSMAGCQSPMGAGDNPTPSPSPTASPTPSPAPTQTAAPTPVPIYALTYTAGANGSISGTSQQFVHKGDSGTAVTAVPAANYHFVDWSDGGMDNPRTDANVLANISVAAAFALNGAQFNISYSAGTNGSISGPATQTVYQGEKSRPVTAVPAAHYHFVQWSDGSTSNPRSETNVAADVSVTASFAINALFTLSYAAGTDGSISGEFSQTVYSGENGAAVTAVPDAHCHFTGWSDGSVRNPRTDMNVTRNINVTANFAIDSFTLTYNAGAHGTISGNARQTVAYGESGTTVTAVPDVNCYFTSWSDGISSTARQDTSVASDISVTANFIPALTLSGTISAFSKGSPVDLSGGDLEAFEANDSLLFMPIGEAIVGNDGTWSMEIEPQDVATPLSFWVKISTNYFSCYLTQIITVKDASISGIALTYLPIPITGTLSGFADVTAIRAFADNSNTMSVISRARTPIGNGVVNGNAWSMDFDPRYGDSNASFIVTSGGKSYTRTEPIFIHSSGNAAIALNASDFTESNRVELDMKGSALQPKRATP